MSARDTGRSPKGERGSGRSRRPSWVAGARGRLAAVRRGPLPRLAPLAAAVVALVATFAVILLMTVRVTDGQYRLVELRAQQQALEQESESLTQDLEFHQAPQNLAIAAQDEGMVPAPAEQGVVDLTTDEVWGEPVPAPEPDDDETVVAVPPPIQTGSSAADEAQEQARERRDALPSSDEQAREQREQAQEAEQDVDLHGGSLPAPQQRGPQAEPTPTEPPPDAPDAPQTQEPAQAAAAGEPAQDPAAEEAAAGETAQQPGAAEAVDPQTEAPAPADQTGQAGREGGGA